MGWGTIFSGGPTSDQLNNVKLTIYDELLCKDVVKSYPKDFDRQICAGTLNGDGDSCQGDSGAGLFTQDVVDNKIKYVASGLVSYGEGCATPG
jgi:secreted trypsin-like serine protease